MRSINVLATQRISADDRAKVFKTLEALQPGQNLRVTVFRGGKIVELTMTWTGFSE